MFNVYVVNVQEDGSKTRYKSPLFSMKDEKSAIGIVDSVVGPYEVVDPNGNVIASRDTWYE